MQAGEFTKIGSDGEFYTEGNLAIEWVRCKEERDKRNNQKSEQDKIVNIPLTKIIDPEYNPFNLPTEKDVAELVKSIKEYGVREPCIVRPQNGNYELLCGQRRKLACEILGIKTLPCVVRELSDDEAILTMVDSNLLHRELLPSEKAWAYRLKFETLSGYGENAISQITAETGESKNQIYRYIRLTELVPWLSDKVDGGLLAFNPAVEISYLSRSEQNIVADFMEENQTSPTLSQAINLKKLKKEGELNAPIISEILSDDSSKRKPKSETSKFKKYFPKCYTQAQMEQIICSLLDEWSKNK
jgi:ParB family chromosome partitioning protein